MLKEKRSKIEGQLIRDAQQLWNPEFPEYESKMNQCAQSIAQDIFAQLGFFKKKGEVRTASEIMAKADSASHYLLSQLLFLLTEDGVLNKSSDAYEVADLDTEMAHPAEFLTRLASQYPSEGITFQWLARAYGGMMPLIRGQAYPEDILFPWGDTTLAEQLYNSSDNYAYYSKLAAQTVALFGAQAYDRPISLLEVGAGTGNGTGMVLEKFDNFDQYRFTDISRSLVRKSSKKLKGNEFMSFGLLDIDKPPTDQNVPLGEFDVVFAVNVLHATQDATSALENMAAYLRSDGQLIVAEISPPKGSIYRFMELTFGLIPSYNGYADKENRPLSPLLDQESWATLFRSAGFSEAAGIPGNAFEHRGGVMIGYK